MVAIRSKSLRNFRRIAAVWQAESDLERVVARHTGRVVNKWKHYYPVYARHFGHLRGRSPRIFEIGVADGGSLDLWREYFGKGTAITGLDIDPSARRCEAQDTAIYIGDQGDRDLLRQIGEERGPFDLVIEDGSHQFPHQIAAFETLFPYIVERGAYACEDLHTSYLANAEYGGGVGKAETFAQYAMRLVDAQHAWFTEEFTGAVPGEHARSVFAVHFYPCLAIVEKRAMAAPAMWAVGRLL